MDLVDLSETSSISALLYEGRSRELCKALESSTRAKSRNVRPLAILVWE